MATGIEFVDAIAGGLNLANPLSLGINVILSTLIGGFVFLIIVKILSSAFHETIKSYHAFLVVLLINIINMFGVINLLPLTSPILVFAIQAVIWILLTKAGFREMAFKHAVIVGIVGFVVTIFVIPSLVALAASYLPIK